MTNKLHSQILKSVRFWLFVSACFSGVVLADSSKLSAVCNSFLVTPTRSVSQLPEALSIAQPSEIQSKLGDIIPILKKAKAENRSAFTRSVNIIFQHDLSTPLINGTMSDKNFNSAILQLYRSYKLEPASISSGATKISALKQNHELRGDMTGIPALFFLVSEDGEKIGVEMLKSLQISGTTDETGTIEYERNGTYGYRRHNFTDTIIQNITVALGPDSKIFTLKLFPSENPIRVTADAIVLKGPEVECNYDSVKLNGNLVRKKSSESSLTLSIDPARLNDEENTLILFGGKVQTLTLGANSFPKPHLRLATPTTGFAEQDFSLTGSGLYPLGKLSAYEKNFPVTLLILDSLSCDTVRTPSSLTPDSIRFRFPPNKEPGNYRIVVKHKWGADTFQNPIKILPAPAKPRKWYADWEFYANAGSYATTMGLLWGHYLNDKNYYEERISKLEREYRENFSEYEQTRSMDANQRMVASAEQIKTLKETYSQDKKFKNLALTIAISVPITITNTIWFFHWKNQQRAKQVQYSEYRKLLDNNRTAKETTHH